MNIKNVICPYYLSQSDKRIRCEGVIEGTKVSSEFSQKEEKDEYMEIYCGTHDYLQCPIASKVEEAYNFEDIVEEIKKTAGVL